MILGSRRSYVGPRDRVLSDKVVVLIAVHRDGERLERDDEIECIRPDDLVEVSPLIRFDDDIERPSCFSHEIPPTFLA